jgi:hypothetical protein
MELQTRRPPTILASRSRSRTVEHPALTSRLSPGFDADVVSELATTHYIPGLVAERLIHMRKCPIAGSPERGVHRRTELVDCTFTTTSLTDRKNASTT